MGGTCRISPESGQGRLNRPRRGDGCAGGLHLAPDIQGVAAIPEGQSGGIALILHRQEGDRPGRPAEQNGQDAGGHRIERTCVSGLLFPTRRRRTAQQANDVIVSGLSKQSIPSIVKPSLDRGSPQKGFGISQRRFPARLAVRRP